MMGGMSPEAMQKAMEDPKMKQAMEEAMKNPQARTPRTPALQQQQQQYIVKSTAAACITVLD